MPTYTVTLSVQGLTSDKKQRIATGITHAHHGATGAQRFFAEVIFRDVDRGDFFIGGKPLKGDSIYIHGHIRAGRSSQQKQELMAQILEAVTEAAAVPARSVWIYISDIPATSMVEFGHVLPAPGEEASWLKGLPEDDRRFLAELDS